MRKLSGKDLASLQCMFFSEFQLDLPGTTPFMADQVLKLVKKKRVLAIGHWQGQRVFAKLMFHTKYAQQHYAEEVAGLQGLIHKDVLVPKVLFRGMSADQSIYVLLFEYIDGKELRELWENKSSVDAIMPLFAHIMQDMAKHHASGVLQTDMNLKNYFITSEKRYLIDAAHIKTFPECVPDADCIQNLALMMSYCGVQLIPKIPYLFDVYCQARGWHDVQTRLSELYREINIRGDKRWRRYSQKIFMNSRDFDQIEKSGSKFTFKHIGATPALLTFFDELTKDDFCIEPQRVTPQAQNVISTPVTLDNNFFILKQFQKQYLPSKYNFFKTNPAIRTWLLAHRLNFFGLKTTTPIALIEVTKGKFSSQYYYLAQAPVIDKQQMNLDQALFDFLQNLIQMRLMVCDMKPDDFSVTEHGQILLTTPEKLIQFKSMTKLKDYFEQTLQSFLGELGENSKLGQTLAVHDPFQQLATSPISIPI